MEDSDHDSDNQQEVGPWLQRTSKRSGGRKGTSATKDTGGDREYPSEAQQFSVSPPSGVENSIQTLSDTSKRKNAVR